MKKEKQFDLIIIGGGIAGMTAAIFTARANLKTVILEEEVCGGLANWTHTVENFPSHISINGMELMDNIFTQVENLGVVVDQPVEIQELNINQQVKTVVTEDTVYKGKAIILATGRKPINLKVDSDSERIHYCSVCDGAAYKGKKVMVVGGGNSGFDESLYMLSIGIEEILMVEALDECCAADSTQSKLRRGNNVEIKTSTKVVAVDKEGDGCRVVLENTKTGESETAYVDGVFVFIGQKANTQLFSKDIDLDSYGYIIAGENQGTKLPGVYAAGDVVKKEHRYLTTAMSDGTIAAMSVERYIRDMREKEDC